MQLHAIRAFDDNYIWLIDASDDKHCAVVDPGQAAPVLEYLDKHQLTLSAILITHHHHDHTGGIDELVARFDCPVFGPHNSIAGITHRLEDGDTIKVPDLPLELAVLACPGHTLDHIAFYAEPWLFCGDTLFSAGCGRMFEGEPNQFFSSLQRFRQLPEDTLVYCAHEYTAANLAFAKAVEPDNRMLDKHSQWVQKKRQQDMPTLPSTLALEAEINPFLRCHLQSVKDAAQIHAQTSLSDPVEVFACLRNWKDNF
ncbi:hydroxyacylglutathione hydrolase [Aliidiomarina sedimenti]|uniref:Hydroxyacylglutathione hydrolase n=1 Tax=Aliidiomarina sedimenti TaxID=1933879 RepID=A0ABY0BX65_9GAMM|nr:hydroxyacylglutathione hydrolase [Aliidiomarina sedimenti]RUO28828.1 hydroxyacylglutathione hydrolase [Aliidiomarina sedimenti]